MKNDDIDSVITCAKIEDTSHPDYCLSFSDQGYVQFGLYRPDCFTRQNLTPRFSCHGLVLASRVESYLAQGTFYTNKCQPIIVNDSIGYLI